MFRIIECVRCYNIGMSCNVSSWCKFPVLILFPLYFRSYLFVSVYLSILFPVPFPAVPAPRPFPIKNTASDMGERFSRPFSHNPMSTTHESIVIGCNWTQPIATMRLRGCIDPFANVQK